VRGIRVRANVGVPARDGTRLSTDLYLPAASSPAPAVLIRTPYDNTLPFLVEKGRRLADHGYAVAISDCRGRFDSDGAYEPFRNEGPDGFDTVEWLAAQPWCDGRVGMAGRSYAGWTQWTAAQQRPPHLRTIVPRAMATDLHRGLVWRGGAFNLGVLLLWGLTTSGRSMQDIDRLDWTEAFRTRPLIDAADVAGQDVAHWRAWLDHPLPDEWWTHGQSVPMTDIEIPALVMGGWYDLYADDMLTAWAGLRAAPAAAARRSTLVVGPWPHALSESTVTGELDFGARSQVDLEGLELRWFDRWLKDVPNEVADEAPMRLFVMGANVWRDEHEWPLARTDWQAWHLHSGGAAATSLGDGSLSRAAPAVDEPPDAFTYHPDHPVPTTGGPNCCWPALVPWGPYDQRGVEMRADVLCYTSDTLGDDLEVTGPIRVVLYAATDGRDTDWTAKLVDVWPTGRAINLCDGIIRARFRGGFAQEVLVEPGRVERYEIELMATSNLFLAGHRIRVEISSSNFPRFDRNPNTGAPIGRDSAIRVARQTILHTADAPSHVLLPVIPPG
jgi:putative CocE/NonD family hydrolase